MFWIESCSMGILLHLDSLVLAQRLWNAIKQVRYREATDRDRSLVVWRIIDIWAPSIVQIQLSNSQIINTLSKKINYHMKSF